MTITLPPKIEKLVQDRLKNRQNASAAEVVVEALELLERQDRQAAREREELEAKVLVGVEQIERGETYSGEEVRREIMQEINSRREPRHA